MSFLIFFNILSMNLQIAKCNAIAYMYVWLSSRIWKKGIVEFFFKCYQLLGLYSIVINRLESVPCKMFVEHSSERATSQKRCSIGRKILAIENKRIFKNEKYNHLFH